MPRLLIDPPVSYLSPAREIAAWLDRLETMRLAHDHDRDALADIRVAKADARQMLAERRRMAREKRAKREGR